MSTFVTADPHFGHERIIALCRRPFASVDEMNRVLIERWNERVKPKDVVYLLGDVFLKMPPREAMNIRAKLAGNIHLICGNHDDVARSMPNAWAWTKDLYQLKFPDFKAIMTHFPLRAWPGSYRGVANLHGHSHGNLPLGPFSQIDVGVDCHDFYPIALEHVQALIDAQQAPPPVDLEAPATVEELHELIWHMWTHEGCDRSGFKTMSLRQREIYQTVLKHTRPEPWKHRPVHDEKKGESLNAVIGNA